MSVLLLLHGTTPEKAPIKPLRLLFFVACRTIRKHQCLNLPYLAICQGFKISISCASGQLNKEPATSSSINLINKIKNAV